MDDDEDAAAYEEKEEDKATKLDCNVLKVKLPKLIIARFNGTLIDWFRLVGIIIDGLPFTSEGYTKAKNILISKYGKSSKVANVHIQNKMSLPISIV